MREDLPLKGICHGEEKLLEGDSGLSSVIFEKKKQLKNKYEKVVSTESKDQH